MRIANTISAGRRVVLAVLAGLASIALLAACGDSGSDADTYPELSDREVLVIFYNATGGPNWSYDANWLSDMPIGEWYGIATDPNGRVIKIYLDSIGLSGETPAELGNLANLEWLHLSENALSGEIPPELGNLANLKWLYLSDNALSGTIPPALGNLANLEALDLSNNRLTGEIPTVLGDLPNLAWVELGENRFSGCVPAGLRSVLNISPRIVANANPTMYPPNDFDRLGLPFCEDGG